MSLVDAATEAGARRERACEVLGVSVRSVERWRSEGGSNDQRRGPSQLPAHTLTADERAQALQIVNSPEYRDFAPEQIVARLADQGTYLCSERSLDRILHEHKQHKHRERTRPAEHAKPREYVAHGPNQVMTWDITYLHSPVRGQYYYLYLFLDIWSRRIMGFQVREVEDSQLAAQLLRRICSEHQLEDLDMVLHSDNGAAMKGSTMLATIKALGIRGSFSRPGVSDDNAHVEALFRTLKYRPGYPRTFDSLEHARAWASDFVHWYNHEHMHSAIGFVTPDDRHTGRDITILENRKLVYAQARQRHPRRWTGSCRKWHRPRIVMLNPETATKVRLKAKAMAA